MDTALATTIAERLKWAIENQPGPKVLQRQEIADECGISTQALWNAESGATDRPRFLPKAARILKRDPTWLLTGDGSSEPVIVKGMAIHVPKEAGLRGDNFREVQQKNLEYRMLPIVNVISAGDYCEAVEAALANPDEYKLAGCPAPCGPRSFWVIVQGRSMTSSEGPTYNHGDMIAMDRDAAPIPGYPVIAMLPTGECTLKNYELEDDGATAFLLALNPTWPDRRTPMPEGTEVYASFIGRFTTPR